jgi:hypothetical protein
MGMTVDAVGNAQGGGDVRRMTGVPAGSAAFARWAGSTVGDQVALVGAGESAYSERIPCSAKAAARSCGYGFGTFESLSSLLYM